MNYYIRLTNDNAIMLEILRDWGFKTVNSMKFYLRRNTVSSKLVESFKAVNSMKKPKLKIC